MNFWPSEQVRDIEQLDFSDLSGTTPEDHDGINALKEEARARNLAESILLVVSRYTDAFRLDAGRSGSSDLLKAQYGHYKDVPRDKLHPTLASFARDMHALLPEMQKFHIGSPVAIDASAVTLFDLFDIFESLLLLRSSLSDGIYVRSRSPLQSQYFPLGKPFLGRSTGRDPSFLDRHFSGYYENRNRGQTFRNVVRDHLPGYHPESMEYVSHQGLPGWLISLVGGNDPYHLNEIGSSLSSLKEGLSLLRERIFPGLERALAHYITLRSERILENLIVVRKNVSRVMTDETLDSAHRQLQVELELVTDFLECRDLMENFFTIRAAFYQCLKDGKEIVANLERDLDGKPDNLLPRALDLRGILFHISGLLEVDHGVKPHILVTDNLDSPYLPAVSRAAAFSDRPRAS